MAISNDDLQRWHELCDKATPGPWKLRFDDSGTQYASAWVSPDDVFTFDDMDFVDAARQALPELIAALKEAWRKIDELEQENCDMADDLRWKGGL